MPHGCRPGNMPAVKTIKAALKGFSDQKAIVIRTRGHDVSIIIAADGCKMTKIKVLIFDNVQHFHKQRDFRIRRENSMIIGIAGFFFEFLIPLTALDSLDKRKRIEHSRRPQLTVDDLLSLIDQAHLKTVGILQFIEALTNYIPHAECYKKDLGKNEASIVELKDAMLDFMEQLGQTQDDYDPGLILGGGDGMSYNNMHLLQKISFKTTDIFGYFEEHSRLNTLPSFEELEIRAKDLFETYVSSRSRYQVLADARDEATSDIPHAPLGAPWKTPAETSTSSKKPKCKVLKTLKVGATTAMKKAPKKKENVTKPIFVGDRVGFDNGTFMHDAMISREVAAAVAQGDVMVFIFGGSSHSKYMNYLLEMIVDLEFEYNPFLRDATLMSKVISPDGIARPISTQLDPRPKVETGTVPSRFQLTS
ncbi:hypothetical protein B0H13DRAFT_2310589 [Mycena leptocephala]|nr:hypothetical protein B0H13DRAFT_2310589 [Mycena leptocephala]